MELSDYESRFRISYNSFLIIYNAISRDLSHNSQRNKALSPFMQISIALRLFASGSIYAVIADAHGISKASVSRCARKVSRAIVLRMLNTYIAFDNDPRIPAKFYSMARMPCVAGIIDGTHIKIATPSTHEEQFVNRKGYHSLNVMAVCGPDLQFYAVNSSWPGSTNDARVLRNSGLAQQFNSGYRPFNNAVLLGDSGYPCLSWLMTPINSPNLSDSQERYNQSHKKTRRLVENSFGVLKNRFIILMNIVRSEPEQAAFIILACCVLHNLCIRENGEAVFEAEIFHEEEADDENYDGENFGQARRQNIVNSFES